tara:strand:+ start:3033 stop:3992 length:960 start_codon:yes stop_codon:yes gene_type:complete
MKYLEDTPDFICKSGDENFVIYSDTDSIYIHAKHLLKHLYPTFDEMSDEEKDNKLEKLAIKYQNLITDSYTSLTKETFNVYKFPWFEHRKQDHWLEMKTEAVIRSAYFRATRRYAQWITKQEGIVKESLDIKGLEFKKANFPPILGKFFKEILIDILKGTKQNEIDIRIKDYRKKILDGSLSLVDLGNPVSVKTLNKYTLRKARAGEMFSQPAKGAPASVKATIAYNDLIRFWKLDKKHNYITQGEKVKWIYLRPNSYQVDAMAFSPSDTPDKILAFIEEYADRKKIFESILLNKLEGLYSDMEWHLNLNPFINKFFIL